MKVLNLLLALLLAGNVYCAKKVYVDGNGKKLDKKTVQTIKEKKQETTRHVHFADLKTWSRGTLETKGLCECFCVIGWYNKGSEKFGFMSHYPKSNVSGHLYAIKQAKNNWLFMENYDDAVIIAFMLDNSYIARNDGGEYIKNYKKKFGALVSELRMLFPDAKIFGQKYDNNEEIEFNIDNGCYFTRVGKDTVDLSEFLD